MGDVSYEAKRVQKVCRTCGSDAVRLDAFASWDEDAQAWVLDTIYDHEWCNTCEGETTIEERIISP